MVYLSILDFQYSKGLLREAFCKCYSGLTINEEQRAEMEFTGLKEGKIKGFSVKVNKRGHCMNETIILPNLKVIKNYKPYL